MIRLPAMIVAVALVAAAAVAAPLAPTPATAAPSCEGVWVVVDPGALGGSPTTRCAPGDPPSGVAALTAASFSWTYVSTFPGMICRIDGEPASADCDRAPPNDAHWAYWHADAGGSWTYARTGAHLRDPKPGEVEGWVFGTGSAPSVAPPAEPPPPPAPEPEPEPDPDPEPRSGGGSASGSGGSSGSAGSGGSSGSASAGTGSDLSTGERASGDGATPSARESDDDAIDDAAEDGSPADPGLRAAPPSADRQAHGLLKEDTAVLSTGRDDDRDAEPVETGGTDRRSPDGDGDGGDTGDRLASREVEGSKAPVGIVVAGVLLAAMAGLGVLTHRRRSGA